MEELPTVRPEPPGATSEHRGLWSKCRRTDPTITKTFAASEEWSAKSEPNLIGSQTCITNSKTTPEGHLIVGDRAGELPALHQLRLTLGLATITKVNWVSVDAASAFATLGIYSYLVTYYARILTSYCFVCVQGSAESTRTPWLSEAHHS